MQITVTGGTISEAEKNAYIARALHKYRVGEIQVLCIHVDGEYVNLSYYGAPKPFHRIRDAKTAEERDRVKHL